MKRIILLTGTLIAGIFLNSQTVFQKAISIPFSTASEVASITPCSDGGYIMSTSQGYSTGGIMKVDANGVVSWSKIFALDSTFTLGYCAGECNGGGYYFLGGDYDNYTGVVNNFMVKMDASGNTIWTKEFQANLEFEGTPTVFQTANGDFLISTIGMEMGLTRLSSNGNILYQERYGLDTSNTTKVPPVGAAMGTDGGVLITSNMTGLGLVKTDASGNILWTKDYYDNTFATSYYPGAITATSDGGFVIGGIDYMGNTFLMKIDVAGNIVWRKLFFSSSQPMVTGLSEAPNGNLQIAGIDIESHALVAQFDASGNFLSGGVIGNPNSSQDYFSTLAIHSCSDNGMIVGGLCENMNTSAQATSIFKTNSSGNLGCEYNAITMTDVTGSTAQPTDAQTVVYRMNITGTVNQQQINPISNSPIETDFCLLFSTDDQSVLTANISAFPSPIVSGENLKLNVAGVEGNSVVNIYDASGKIVKQLNQEFSFNTTSSLEISTADLRSGIYLVRITGADQKVLGMTRFIVR